MEVMINKDIRSYKVKDIGPFTLPQAASLLVAGVLAYGIYWLEKHMFNLNTLSDIQIISIIIMAAPPLVFGFVRPYGISFFAFLRTVFFENIMSPKTRIFKSESVPDYDIPEKDMIIYMEDDTPEDQIFTFKPKSKKDLGIKPTRKITKEEKEELKYWKAYA